MGRLFDRLSEGQSYSGASMEFWSKAVIQCLHNNSCIVPMRADALCVITEMVGSYNPRIPVYGGV